MIWGYVNTALAFAFQITGGGTLAMITGAILAQTNGVSLDPALAASYGAIGALFGLVTWLTKGRIERCEKREDKLLDDDGTKTTAIRDMSATVTKAADVAAGSVVAANAALEESKRNGAKIDGLANAIVPEIREIRSTASDLARRVDDLSRRLDSGHGG